jgi:Glyoxalase-like domain
MTGLDHIILGVSDLDRGVVWVERQTGVRARFGGVHPGRGTRNALLALGPDCYLEIIAPDPAQAAPAWFTRILTLHEPRLVGWAVHTPDLIALANFVKSGGIAIDGPHDGARSAPDGRILRWKLFRLGDDRGGLLPFFIEWSRDTIHPVADAPSGCRLTSFHLCSPDANELGQVCEHLGVNVVVKPDDHSHMRALIIGSQGEVELTS